jgi:hypothetical protein
MDVTAIGLPEEYMKQAGEHAQRRIITAGVRLGSLWKREADSIMRHLRDESLLAVVQLPEGLKNSRQIRDPRAFYWVDVRTE